MIESYAQLAHANGIRYLQLGRWPHIKHRLQDLESGHPGITQAVLARISELKLSASASAAATTPNASATKT